MFHESQNDEYMATIVKRAREVYLEWVEQVLDIIEEVRDQQDTEFTVNDIGCNVGQFWKGLKRRSLPVEYRGYDVEPLYLKAAAEVFPELAGRLHLLDICDAQPGDAKVSVSSATLEHLPDVGPALNNILAATHSLAVLRTFLGDRDVTAEFMKPAAKRPYLINQYSSATFTDHIEKAGFSVKIVKDRYTNSVPVDLGQGIVRSQYIVIATRRHP